MCTQIISAIKYLHVQDPLIIHRDIKSPNYLVTIKYMIKLCDFNLSRADTKENRVGTLETWRTTPAWSAPEIINCRYTEKSDIYSLGIVLWEILFLLYNKYHRYPFVGYNEVTITTRLILDPDSRPPLENIPSEWVELLEKMWCIDPQVRPKCSKILKSINKIKTLYTK